MNGGKEGGREEGKGGREGGREQGRVKVERGEELCNGGSEEEGE